MENKECQEVMCKLIVEMKFPNKFFNLIKGESPDWHNDNIGLEVRQAIEPNYEALTKKLVDNYSGKFLSDIPKEKLKFLGFTSAPKLYDAEKNLYYQQSEKVGKLIYCFVQNKNDYMLLQHISKFSEPVAENSKLFINAIKEKLTKLNKNYDLYNENDLILRVYDFVEYSIRESDINSMIGDYVSEIQNEYSVNTSKIKFKFIYLFFNDALVEVDCSNWSFKKERVIQEDWDEIKNKLKLKS